MGNGRNVGTVGTMGSEASESRAHHVGTEASDVGTRGGVLPRPRSLWPSEALHLWRERLAMRGEYNPEAEAWAEEVTRAAWVAPLPAAWTWPGDGSWEAWVAHVRAMPTGLSRLVDATRPPLSPPTLCALETA